MRRFIIIGAGILGASTAYHLAKAGAHVTLVDRQDLGQATDAAAGIISPWLSQRRNQAWYRLAKGGAKFYSTLINELEAIGETNTGYKRVGAIYIHSEDEKLDQLEERAHKRREDAPEIGEITRLSSTETKRIFPILSEKYASLYVSGAARIDGRAMRQSLVNAARKHGAVILQGDATLVYNDNQVLGVKVEGKQIQSDQVIITAGAWAKELLQPLNIQYKGTFQKGQIVHLHMQDVDTENWPVVMPPSNQYILTFTGGRVVVGTTHEDATEYDLRVTTGGLHEILDKALFVAPGLVDSTLLEIRVGFRPFTPGFLPVIGSVPKYKGLLIANGLGSSGLTVGPYLGSELAKLALGLPTEINLADYDVALAIGAVEK